MIESDYPCDTTTKNCRGLHGLGFLGLGCLRVLVCAKVAGLGPLGPGSSCTF